MSAWDDEPLQGGDPLCECSWQPDPPDGPFTATTLALSSHTLRKHRAHGAGRCLGRDSYGLPCDCPSFTPMPTT